MKKVRFLYNMQIEFSENATEHSFSLKCIPHSDERQKIEEMSVEVYPTVAYAEGKDSFGNKYLYGKVLLPHRRFEIKVSGVITTGLAQQAHDEENFLVVYKQQDEVTKPGDCIKSLFSQLYRKKDNAFDSATNMMQGLYEKFVYQAGVTTFSTTAEEAARLGMGVCQDYSNILMSLCRMAKIPARYVVGMLEGEGASHAWIEVYSDGAWYALDPTNNLIISDGHVAISHGRNYKDCRINKGIFYGGGDQCQTVHVKLEDLLCEKG